MKKTLISMTMVVVMLLGMTSVSAMEDNYIATNKPITVTYNGEQLNFGEAVPIVVEDRTMVPMRGIFEKVGCEVSFEASTQMIKVNGKNEAITLQIGSKTAAVEKDGKADTLNMDVAPLISEGRTLVPVRFISETLGLKVNWNANFREVVLIDINAWKEKINTDAKMLDAIFNRPLIQVQPMLAESSGKMNFAVKLEGMKDEIGKVIPTIDTNVAVTIAQADKYDGKAGQSKSVLKSDLSSLSKIIEQFADEANKEMLLKYAKNYEINLDVIIDTDWNIYLKSKEILAILKDCGLGDISDLIGDKYLKIPVEEILKTYLGDISLEDYQGLTLWELFEKFIESDSYLYSESVKVIDTMIGFYASFYSNEYVSETTEKDGTKVLTYQVDKTAFQKLVSDMVASMGSIETMTEEAKKEQEMLLDKFTFDLKMTMKQKDDVITAMDMLYQYGVKEMEIDGAKLTILMDMNMNYNTKAYEKTEKNIEIPTDVIDILESFAY